MELRLQQLISSVEGMTDIHNLDYSNPVLLNMRHPEYNPADPSASTSPLINSIFRMAAAVDEPANLGLPVHAIWFVMQPYNAFYRRALKLMDVRPPSESNVNGAITNAGFAMTWVEITRYDMAFNVLQSYGDGEQGPPGPRGDRQIIFKSNAWSPTVDYAKADGVKYQGGYYVAVAASTNKAPADNPDVWMQLSAIGDDPVIDYDYLVAEVERRLNGGT